MAELFQSTPPRGGRHDTYRRTAKYYCISIHAPARGATADEWCRYRQAGDFNPRPREGGDRLLPVTGKAQNHFNPRPREGGDLISARQPSSPEGFQSTPPRGGRRKRCRRCPKRAPFQSTPPRGGRRQLGRFSSQSILISIHAPARGATTARQIQQPKHSYFNPRPREGGDKD